MVRQVSGARRARRATRCWRGLSWSRAVRAVGRRTCEAGADDQRRRLLARYGTTSDADGALAKPAVLSGRSTGPPGAGAEPDATLGATRCSASASCGTCHATWRTPVGHWSGPASLDPTNGYFVRLLAGACWMRRTMLRARSDAAQLGPGGTVRPSSGGSRTARQLADRTAERRAPTAWAPCRRPMPGRPGCKSTPITLPVLPPARWRRSADVAADPLRVHHWTLMRSH